MPAVFCRHVIGATRNDPFSIRTALSDEKRVSARHQVKRLDRISKALALSEAGPAEETSFLRSVRIA
jgi:hypothetical protein